MKKLPIILLITVTTQLSAQIHGNRYARLTKQEFKELIASKDKFVPTDLGDTVVIVKYSGQRLLEMQTTAGLEPWSTNLTDEQISKRKINADKFATWFSEKLKKELQKKNKESIIVDEGDLEKNRKYLDKYWLKTIYVSDREAVNDDGWIMTVTNMFYDPRNDKHYEIFLPLNYDLLDLVR